jgi:mono/diheme cytochrome c family protein
MSVWSRMHPLLRGLVAFVVFIGLIALGGFLWIALGPGSMDFAGRKSVALADYHAPDPTGVPPDLAKAGLIERGRYLTRAADCEACHTAKGGAAYAGGLAFVLPFGTLYSTNITPDKETGIGDYTDADFLNSVHRGVRRDGKLLYPAMPYASYSAMTDGDALAIKAYLFSLAPLHAPAPANTLGFPFNQRWLMAGWSLLFNADRRFGPHEDRSPEWNRGAYLVEAMAHCGECHTPRNLFQGLDNRSKFTGAIQAGWHAYNITPDPSSGVGAWSDQELQRYLAVGHAAGRGTAAGPMGEAVDKSLNYLSQADIAAIVTYLRSIPPIQSADFPEPKAQPAPSSPKLSASAQADPLGKQIFESACASCHGWTGESQLTSFATFVGSRSVNDPSATNVAQIIIAGAERRTPTGAALMPSFGHAYSDAEIAAVANYVTTRFGSKPSAVSAEDVAKLRLTE